MKRGNSGEGRAVNDNSSDSVVPGRAGSNGHPQRMAAFMANDLLACSFLVIQLIRGLLFGVRSWRLLTLAAVAVVLGISVLLASYIPARRAASINPLGAPRVE